jgi:hypothetical protein
MTTKKKAAPPTEEKVFAVRLGPEITTMPQAPVERRRGGHVFTRVPTYFAFAALPPEVAADSKLSIAEATRTRDMVVIGAAPWVDPIPEPADDDEKLGTLRERLPQLIAKLEELGKPDLIKRAKKFGVSDKGTKDNILTAITAKLEADATAEEAAIEEAKAAAAANPAREVKA